jgi:hypothetical protein
MYQEVYGNIFSKDMTDITMLITRVISYYLSMVVCAAITLYHHMRPRAAAADCEAPEAELQPCDEAEQTNTFS